jgi:hypothetical protein
MHGGLQVQLIELQQPQLDREFNDLLLESIDETITSLLSRTVVDALCAHLQTFHSITRDDLLYRVDTLFTTLEKTFDVPSSQTISKAIARKIHITLGLEVTDNPGHIFD